MSSEQPQNVCIDCRPASNSQADVPSDPAANVSKKNASTTSALPGSAPGDALQEDVMNPATFPLPNLAKEVHVVIEYCNRCRWNARATWVQTELLNTFSPSGDSEATSDSSPSTISAISIIPRSDPATAGRFRIWLYKAGSDGNQPILIHDRKTDGGFAEMKVIKQKIREHIDPNRGLGHSDKAGKNKSAV